MDTSLFDYELPKSLVAKRPLPQRDDSRLFVLHRDTGKTEHRQFFDIVDYLRPGDVLITNDTKVVRARLIGEKEGGGARVELFLIRKEGMPNHYSEDWVVLARPAKVCPRRYSARCPTEADSRVLRSKGVLGISWSG